MLSGRIAAECAYVDERSGVGSGSNPQLRSRGNTESNSDGRRGASAGLGRRSRLPCSDLLSPSDGFFLNLTFATRKPLNGLGEARAAKVLTSAPSGLGVVSRPSPEHPAMTGMRR